MLTKQVKGKESKSRVKEIKTDISGFPQKVESNATSIK